MKAMTEKDLREFLLEAIRQWVWNARIKVNFRLLNCDVCKFWIFFSSNRNWNLLQKAHIRFTERYILEETTASFPSSLLLQASAMLKLKQISQGYVRTCHWLYLITEISLSMHCLTSFSAKFLC